MHRNVLLWVSAAVLAFSSPLCPAQAQKKSPEQIDAQIEKAKQNPNLDPATREMLSLPYVKGPSDVPITDRAHITLENDAQYLDSTSSKRYLELQGNLPDGTNIYIVMPRDQSWWSTYAFEDTGYIKDDEHLDPDALLSKLKENQISSNEERRKHGLNTLTLDGWQVTPHYDPQTKQLEWGLALHDDATGKKLVNYTIRILGREGVVAATLITEPENFDNSLAEFRQSTAGFQYNPDHSYQSFRQGDKVAEYGLGALIVGGVAAAAVKSGVGKGLIAGAILLFKGFFKVIVVGIGAIFVSAFAKIKKLFGKESS